MIMCSNILCCSRNSFDFSTTNPQELKEQQDMSLLSRTCFLYEQQHNKKLLINDTFKAQSLTGNPNRISLLQVLASCALNMSCSFGQSERPIGSRCMVNTKTVGGILLIITDVENDTIIFATFPTTWYVTMATHLHTKTCALLRSLHNNNASKLYGPSTGREISHGAVYLSICGDIRFCLKQPENSTYGSREFNMTVAWGLPSGNPFVTCQNRLPAWAEQTPFNESYYVSNEFVISFLSRISLTINIYLVSFCWPHFVKWYLE